LPDHKIYNKILNYMIIYFSNAVQPFNNSNFHLINVR